MDLKSPSLNSLKCFINPTSFKNSLLHELLSDQNFPQKKQNDTDNITGHFKRNSSEEFNKMLLTLKPSTTEPPAWQQLWEQYIFLKQMFRSYNVQQDDEKPKNKNKACMCKPIAKPNVSDERKNQTDLYPTKEKSDPLSSSANTRADVTKTKTEDTERPSKKKRTKTKNVLNNKNNDKEYEINESTQTKEETSSKKKRSKPKNDLKNKYDIDEIIQTNDDDLEETTKDSTRAKFKTKERSTNNGKMKNVVEQHMNNIKEEASHKSETNDQQTAGSLSQESLTISELLDLQEKQSIENDTKSNSEVIPATIEEPTQTKRRITMTGDPTKIELVLPFDFDHLCQHSSGKQIKLLLCNNDKHTCQCTHCGTGFTKNDTKKGKVDKKDKQDSKKDSKDDKKEKKKEEKAKKKKPLFACFKKKKKNQSLVTDEALQASTKDKKVHAVSDSPDNIEDWLKNRFELCCKCGKMDIDKPLNGCSIDTLKMLIKMEAKQNYRQINNIIKELNEHKSEIKKLHSVYDKLNAGDMPVTNGKNLEQDVQQLYKVYDELSNKVYGSEIKNTATSPNGLHPVGEDYLPEKDSLLPEKSKHLKSKVKKNDKELDFRTTIEQNNLNQNKTNISNHQKNLPNDVNVQNNKKKNNENPSGGHSAYQKTVTYDDNIYTEHSEQHPLEILHVGTDIPSFHLARCPCQLNWDLYHGDNVAEEETPKEKVKCKVKLKSIFCKSDNSDNPKCDVVDIAKKVSKGILADLKKSASKIMKKTEKKEKPDERKKDAGTNSSSKGVLEEASVESLFRKDFVVYSLSSRVDEVPERDTGSSEEYSVQQMILNENERNGTNDNLKTSKTNSVLVWFKKFSSSDERKSVKAVQESSTSTSSSKKIMNFVKRLYTKSRKSRKSK